jgi:hypothetical protein
MGYTDLAPDPNDGFALIVMRPLPPTPGCANDNSKETVLNYAAALNTF